MSPPPNEAEQSFRQRLLDISRQRNEDFQFVLMRFALERLLYRLASSRYADRFVLKGAFLFEIWMDQPYRPTKDLDLLGFGNGSPVRMARIFADICKVDVEPDGLFFDAKSIAISEIRENQDYDGLRVKLMASLGNARIPLQIDIAFGDTITPAACKVDFPSMLGLRPATIQSYPRESVVSEKLQAAVYLDMQNSRMKDFCDLFWLSQLFSFEGQVLVSAIVATFKRRKTEIPVEIPTFMTQEFSTDPIKIDQWRAFLRKTNFAEIPESLESVLSRLRQFLLPPIKAACSGKSLQLTWPPDGPWQDKKIRL